MKITASYIERDRLLAQVKLRIAAYEKAIARLNGKRSKMRPSERAMTIASYTREADMWTDLATALRDATIENPS